MNVLTRCTIVLYISIKLYLFEYIINYIVMFFLLIIGCRSLCYCFLLHCMATAAAWGGSSDDSTRLPFLPSGFSTDSTSSSTSARELRRSRRRRIRRDPAKLEATGTYKILYNVYYIFKINVLAIICLNSFTDAPRRRGLNVNRQAAPNLVKALPGSRITLLADEHTLKFVGQSAVWFAMIECVVVQRDCPMLYHF